MYNWTTSIFKVYSQFKWTMQPKKTDIYSAFHISYISHDKLQLVDNPVATEFNFYIVTGFRSNITTAKITEILK